MVIGQVKRVRVSPKILHVQFAMNGEAVGRIFLDDPTGKDVVIDSVSPSHKAIHCTIKTEARANHIIEIRLKKQDLIGVITPLTLNIRLKSPAMEEICIKVVF